MGNKPTDTFRCDVDNHPDREWREWKCQCQDKDDKCPKHILTGSGLEPVIVRKGVAGARLPEWRDVPFVDMGSSVSRVTGSKWCQYKRQCQTESGRLRQRIKDEQL